MRLVFALVVLTAAMVVGTATSLTAQEPLTATTISGGGLPHAVRLAPIDHESFLRRLDLPPLLDNEPVLSGPSYTVTSPYWDAGVRAGDITQPLVDDAATYYPEGGFVRTRQGAKVVWTVLDTTQKTILDRYIRHAASLPAEPSVFEVLRASGLAGEPIGITIGELELTPQQRTAFWRNAEGVSPRRTAPLAREQRDEFFRSLGTPSPRLNWIIFNLPAGRTVPMAYSNVSGTLNELNEAVNEGIGIPVPQNWLVPVLGDQADFRNENSPLAPLTIEQEDGAGSPVWWVVMIGGGVLSIAAAVLLQRRLAASHDAQK